MTALFTVTGPVGAPDGTPANGTLIFRLTNEMRISGTDYPVVDIGPIQVVNGAFSQELVPTDANGQGYWVIGDFDKTHPAAPYVVTVPSGGGTGTLGSLQLLQGSPVTFLPGPEGPPGTPGAGGVAVSTSGDVTGATDTAAIAAAMPTTGDLVLDAGTYYVTSLPAFTTGRGLVGQGQGATIINCIGAARTYLRVGNPAAWVAGAVSGTFRDFTLNGSGAAAGSIGWQSGDIDFVDASGLCIQGFTQPGSIDALFQSVASPKGWTERARVEMFLSNGDTLAVFDGGNPSGSGRSFDYSEYDLHLNMASGQDGVVLQGGAQFVGTPLKIRGNAITPSVALGTAGGDNTGTVLTVGEDGSSCTIPDINLAVEADGAFLTHKSVSFGAGSWSMRCEDDFRFAPSSSGGAGAAVTAGGPFRAATLPAASATATAATISGSIATFTAAGTYVAGDKVVITGPIGGASQWANAIGTFSVVTGGSGSFTILVPGTAPTSSATTNFGTIAHYQLYSIPDAKLSGSLYATEPAIGASQTGEAGRQIGANVLSTGKVTIGAVSGGNNTATLLMRTGDVFPVPLAASSVNQIVLAPSTTTPPSNNHHGARARIVKLVITGAASGTMDWTNPGNNWDGTAQTIAFPNGTPTAPGAGGFLIVELVTFNEISWIGT